MKLSAHRDFIRRHGLLAWPVLLAERLLWRLCRVRIYLAYGLGSPLQAPRQESQFQLRVLSAADLAPYADDPAWDLSPSFVDQALKRGHRCVGAFDESNLCGYAWYAQDETLLEPGYSITPLRGLTYSYKHFTHPRVRGRMVQRCLAASAVEARRTAGDAGLVTFIAVDNFSSRRSVESIGARVIGCIVLRPGAQRRGWARHWGGEEPAFSLRIH